MQRFKNQANLFQMVRNYDISQYSCLNYHFLRLFLYYKLFKMTLRRTDSTELKQNNQAKIQINIANVHIKTLQNSSDQIMNPRIQSPKPKHQDNIQPMDIELQNKSSNTSARNQKIPQSIKQSIIKMATGRKVEDELTTSKIALAILERVRKMNKMFVCDICVCEYEEKEKRNIFKCQHEFCTSCLQHYVEYKISRFEQVICPQQFCEQIISLQSQLFQKLPQNQKKKHSKIRAFYIAEKTKSRLCPDQNCIDGIIITENQGHPKCNKCNKTYCPKCFFPEHEGPCEKNQVDFFQNNFKFRQCSSCKAVIQKNQGCNHITCKCKYEFCYLCGGPWNKGNHRCNVSIEQQQRQQAERQQQLQRIQREAEIQRQYEQTCEYKCNCFFKVLAKVLLTPLFILLTITLCMIMMILGLGVFILVIFIGFFGYSMDLICKERSIPFKIVELIFCPLIGLGGIMEALCQIFPRTSGVILLPAEGVRCLKQKIYSW